ncbi:GntR family transcriptional regulator (plasmid) [Mycobacterium sp. TJFP1]
MACRIRVVSVVDATADALRDAIFCGELGPGMPLTESDIASRYDVARPTAKAAIEKLVADMMLERPNHKTARVRRLGAVDVRDIYRTRAIIESEVLRQLAGKKLVPEGARQANEAIRAAPDHAGLAIVKSDMAFHIAMVDAVDSMRISRLYRSLVSEVTLCMAQVQGRNLLDIQLIAAEHDGLLDLIAAGDGLGATGLLDTHLSRARERLVGALGGMPGLGADAEPTVVARA